MSTNKLELINMYNTYVTLYNNTVANINKSISAINQQNTNIYTPLAKLTPTQLQSPQSLSFDPNIVALERTLNNDLSNTTISVQSNSIISANITLNSNKTNKLYNIIVIIAVPIGTFTTPQVSLIYNSTTLLLVPNGNYPYTPITKQNNNNNSYDFYSFSVQNLSCVGQYTYIIQESNNSSANVSIYFNVPTFDYMSYSGYNIVDSNILLSTPLTFNAKTSINNFLSAGNTIEESYTLQRINITVNGTTSNNNLSENLNLYAPNSLQYLTYNYVSNIGNVYISINTLQVNIDGGIDINSYTQSIDQFINLFNSLVTYTV